MSVQQFSIYYVDNINSEKSQKFTKLPNVKLFLSIFLVDSESKKMK